MTISMPSHRQPAGGSRPGRPGRSPPTTRTCPRPSPGLPLPLQRRSESLSRSHRRRTTTIRSSRLPGPPVPGPSATDAAPRCTDRRPDRPRGMAAPSRPHGTVVPYLNLAHDPRGPCVKDSGLVMTCDHRTLLAILCCLSLPRGSIAAEPARPARLRFSVTAGPGLANDRPVRRPAAGGAGPARRRRAPADRGQHRHGRARRSWRAT